MKLTLKVFENGQAVVSKTLGEGVFRLGRSEFCDVVLPNDTVSRSHVEIRVNEASIYFTNMSGPGQLRVNGHALETGEIADGDELLIGPYKILLLHGGVDASAGQEQAANPLAGDGQLAEADGGGFGSSDPAETPLESGGDVFVPIQDMAPEGSSAASIGRMDTDVEAKPVVAKLVFTEGPKKGEELVLDAYEVTFGRSKKADVYLDDERLSRVHCKIARVGLGFRLVDLESHNGTFVNGMRVLEHPLSSFDEIEIGSTKIRFLIHDILLPGFEGNQSTNVVGLPSTGMGQTESVAIAAIGAEKLAEMGVGAHGPGEVYDLPSDYPVEGEVAKRPAMSRRTQILVGAVVGLLLVYLVLPSGDSSKDPKLGAPGVSTSDKTANVKVPPAMPKEYSELGEDAARNVEGHYNSALKAADAQDFESAVAHLKSIHDSLPYYKKSRELLEKYQKKVKEKQIADAQEKAKNDEKQDLAMYLQDGIEYLKEGDFEKAGESFNSAIVIDPTNPIAAKGLRAADAKVRDMEQLPPEVDPETEKKKAVLALFQKAVAALQQKQYQEAINTAEQIRKIELKGDTQYLNEAKQVIDQAKVLQKEEFEPFLIAAKEKFAEGDYNESRNLCEEMLKKDSSYEEARECVLKAKKNLNRLAKEAYTHGYILESMNRIEEAKQYWNRAKNYVRQGDDYFDKVNRKLEYYQ